MQDTLVTLFNQKIFLENLFSEKRLYHQLLKKQLERVDQTYLAKLKF